MSARTPRSTSRQADQGGGTGVGASAAVQRFVDQRLEVERRFFDQRLKTLERRVDDFVSRLPSEGGRLADVHGALDFLKEEVHSLQQRVEEPLRTPPASSRGDSLAARVSAIDGRLGGLETRQARLEESGAGSADCQQTPASDAIRGLDRLSQDTPRGGSSSVRQHPGEDAEALRSRLDRAEAAIRALPTLDGWDGRALDSLQAAAKATKAHVEALSAQLDVKIQNEVVKMQHQVRGNFESELRNATAPTVELRSQLEQVYQELGSRIQDLEARSRRGNNNGQSNGDEQDNGRLEELVKAIQGDHATVTEQLATLTRRLQQTERGVWSSAESRDFRQLTTQVNALVARLTDIEQALEDNCGAGIDDGRLEEVVENVVADLRGELAEQLAGGQEELEARVSENERGLHDMEQALDVQQQSGRVGERVLGLALRLQRAQQGGCDPAMSSDNVVALRDELEDMTEALVSLRGRVQSTEHGLEGVAEAFDRVCGELAELRSRSGATPLSSRDRFAWPRGGSRDAPPAAVVSAEEAQRLEAKVRALDLDLMSRKHVVSSPPEEDAEVRTPRAPAERGPEHTVEESKLTFGGAPCRQVSGAAELLERLQVADRDPSGTLRAVWALTEVVCDLPRLSALGGMQSGGHS